MYKIHRVIRFHAVNKCSTKEKSNSCWAIWMMILFMCLIQKFSNNLFDKSILKMHMLQLQFQPYQSHVSVHKLIGHFSICQAPYILWKMFLFNFWIMHSFMAAYKSEDICVCWTVTTIYFSFFLTLTNFLLLLLW